MKHGHQQPQPRPQHQHQYQYQIKTARAPTMPGPEHAAVAAVPAKTNSNQLANNDNNNNNKLSSSSPSPSPLQTSPAAMLNKTSIKTSINAADGAIHVQTRGSAEKNFQPNAQHQLERKQHNLTSSSPPLSPSNTYLDDRQPQQQQQQPMAHDPNEYNERLLTIPEYRNGLLKYVFTEIRDQNITDKMDRSPMVMAAGWAEAFAPSVASEQSLLPSTPSISSSSIDLINNASQAGGAAGVSTSMSTATATTTSSGASGQTSRSFFGDFFWSFHGFYLPFHCITCLIICILGIFANVTNIIVLSRPNMVTAVNVILTAIAVSDLIVNVSNIPYLIHDLGEPNYAISFGWALYALIYSHITVTAHTISIWLTCVLATWRYCVVCRSQSVNQRNWSVGLAKGAIAGVLLFVPIFCIPNYLSFAILPDKTYPNSTTYKVGFSQLADSSQLIKTFHFWIFSFLVKLVPCILLTFFTSALIRKLLSARERRLRLAAHGGLDNNGNNAQKFTSIENVNNHVLIKPNDEINCEIKLANGIVKTNLTSSTQRQSSESDVSGGEHVGVATIRNDSSDNRASESIDVIDNQQQQQQQKQPRILSQLVVEASKSTTSATSTSTSMAPTKVLSSCDDEFNTRSTIRPISSIQDAESPRSASTCGALESYCRPDQRRDFRHQSMQSSSTISKGLFNESNHVENGLSVSGTCLSLNTNAHNHRIKLSSDRKPSESKVNLQNRQSPRSLGSTSLAPFQIVKLQATQRQLNQNETTTRLLIAVMIVFLICEFPAGILSVLCAIFGQEFFENVYQPMGIVTDLLALINSSVNFVLYCFMSTQFRVTFYQVVLHCPAPKMQPNPSGRNAKLSNSFKQQKNRDVNNY